VRSIVFGIVLFAIAVVAVASATPARADDCPRYLILQPLYCGHANPRPTHAYAYGWFGAMQSSASTWHRTYSTTGVWWTYTPGY
jgi:hypothetical protein